MSNMETIEPVKITSRTYTEEARKVYSESGLTYRDFTRDRIENLLALIKDELYIHYPSSEMRMTMEKTLVKNIKFDKHGGLVFLYLEVQGSYFRKREAISFNTDGFIGFAGWADRINVQPFTKAFIKWINIIHEPLLLKR